MRSDKANNLWRVLDALTYDPTMGPRPLAERFGLKTSTVGGLINDAKTMIVDGTNHYLWGELVMAIGKGYTEWTRLRRERQGQQPPPPRRARLAFEAIVAFVRVRTEVVELATPERHAAHLKGEAAAVIALAQLEGRQAVGSGERDLAPRRPRRQLDVHRLHGGTRPQVQKKQAQQASGGETEHGDNYKPARPSTDTFYR